MNKPIDTIEQHRLQLFVERNRFKDMAEGYERMFAEEREKNNALKIDKSIFFNNLLICIHV